MEGGGLIPGTVHLTNNLYVLNGVTSWFRLIDPAFVTNNNIVVSYSGPEDANYVDLGFANIDRRNRVGLNRILLKIGIGTRVPYFKG